MTYSAGDATTLAFVADAESCLESGGDEIGASYVTSAATREPRSLEVEPGEEGTRTEVFRSLGSRFNVEVRLLAPDGATVASGGAALPTRCA